MLNILEKKENALLSRVEITARISYDKATSSNKEVQEELAKQLSVDPSLVVVKQILPVFGQKESKVNAYTYKDKDILTKIERIKKKKVEAKPEGGEEAPAEAPKQEEKKAPEEKPKAPEKPAEEKK